ncbi:hypothetical protein [Clostridium sartagoforme]|jgi:hypothetical protein|uniref:hypothetical protein n=1 Tax=Clostridium sartagoforme TaxID=84031 RepID=UPI0031D273AD
MDFLENEKDRIKFNYQKLILYGFLFFYFVNTQSNVTAHKVIWGKAIDAKPISLINPIMVLGIITITLYLNHHLFWIKEQGKKVFIIRKYDSIPIDKKEMYIAKFKIIISNLITFIIASIIIYIGILLFNSYLEIDIFKNILDVLQIGILSITLLIIIYTINIIQDKKSKNQL